MQKLNFPQYQFDVKRDDDRLFILDQVRKKWVSLTPEEWVRQHTIAFLVMERKFPAGLIGIEKAVKINQMNKRFDVVCYNQDTNPVLLVECKAPEVEITQTVLDQALRYNSQLQVNYLLLTNGITHVIAFVDYKNKKLEYLDNIPSFDTIKG
ncbi:type I restriction enzyme HsdR N-terminal domain-containing protein [Parvicella tangerina]|uniref:Type I restriction enzyme R protein N-terminal domain-containing protein n=1 Tax=Parvicella tangerina TaxID=2829795 RepID=A0A916NQT8_9FLAO|nr:type I restriction enzyme HsdR N-terminal domain-containing protein [Parvicella tangerina]CAG5079846.1 hypothetical protein CRYO30217_01095 [Parvicella tangerina]